jgi:hypothetical protein
MRALRFPGSVAILLLSGGVAVAGACGGGFSAASGGSGGDAGSEGGAGDGQSGETGGGDSGPGADASHPGDAGADALPSGIIYVAPTGMDTSTGLSSLAPKRSVASALSEARTLGGLPEIHVCAGIYAEAKLSINFNVVLQGSYDCTTWTRTPTYGYPTFDGSNSTSIQNADVTSQSATLALTGAVSSAGIVDGFILVGGTSSSLTLYAMHVGGGASPVVRNSILTGGAGAGGTTAIGEAALLVDGTSAPEISGCVVDGGNGSGNVGSIGVDLNTTGAVNLHDSTVSGGTGTVATTAGTFGAIGIRVRSSLAAATPLLRLLVAGSDSSGAAGKTAGLYVEGAGVSAGLAESSVSGGTPTGSASYAVYAAASGGTLTLADDRLYGGNVKATPGQTIGVYVTAAGGVVIANSMIHAGTVQAATGDFAVGVDLASVAAPVIVASTIYTGPQAGTAIALNSGVSGAIITDDLLLGSDYIFGTYGVAATGCSGMVGTLDHTAFANLGALYECTGADGGATSATTTGAVSSDLGASITGGDLVLQSTCLQPSGCAVEPGCPTYGEGCPTSIFGSMWTADGLSGIVPTTGADGGPTISDWAPAPGSPCALTKGGAPLSSIPTDIDGNPRSATTPTIGAAEYSSPTACQ